MKVAYTADKRYIDTMAFCTEHGLKIRLDINFFTDKMKNILTGDELRKVQAFNAGRSAGLNSSLDIDKLRTWEMWIEYKFLLPNMLLYYVALIFILIPLELPINVLNPNLICALLISYVWGLVLKVCRPVPILDNVLFWLSFPYYILSNSIVRFVVFAAICIIANEIGVLLAYLAIFVVGGVFNLALNGHTLKTTNRKYGYAFNDTEIIAFNTWWFLFWHNILSVDCLIYAYTEHLRLAQLAERNKESSSKAKEKSSNLDSPGSTAPAQKDNIDWEAARREAAAMPESENSDADKTATKSQEDLETEIADEIIENIYAATNALCVETENNFSELDDYVYEIIEKEIELYFVNWTDIILFSHQDKQISRELMMSYIADQIDNDSEHKLLYQRQELFYLFANNKIKIPHLWLSRDLNEAYSKNFIQKHCVLLADILLCDITTDSFCSEEDLTVIRRESLGIISFLMAKTYPKIQTVTTQFINEVHELLNLKLNYI